MDTLCVQHFVLSFANKRKISNLVPQANAPVKRWTQSNDFTLIKENMTDDIKLSSEFKHHGFNVSPKQVSDLLVLRKTLYEMQGIKIKDTYWLVKDLLNDLNIHYTDCEIWEMFFEPPMY